MYMPDTYTRQPPTVGSRAVNRGAPGETPATPPDGEPDGDAAEMPLAGPAVLLCALAPDTVELYAAGWRPVWSF